MIESGDYADTYMVTSIGGAALEKTIYIPSEHKGKPVTVIGGESFGGHPIERVVIAASVEKIESGAFKDCSELTSVTFKTGSNIKSIDGFGNCTSLTSFIVPASATSIQTGCFAGCTALNTVRFELTKGWIRAIHNAPSQNDEADVSSPFDNANRMKQGGLVWYFRNPT